MLELLKNSVITDIPSYVFGSDSYVVHAGNVGVGEALESGGYSILFQVVVLSALIFYMIWVNHWNVRGGYHLRPFALLWHRGTEEPIYKSATATYRSYLGWSSAVGVVIISILLIKELEFFSYSSNGVSLGSFDISTISPLLLFLIPVAIIAFQKVMFWLIGRLFNMADFLWELDMIKGIVFALFVIVTSPIVLLYAISDWNESVVFSYVIVAETIIILGLYLWKSFIFFISKKVSILHWILYLCAVEIFPITLIWGFFKRL